MAQSLNSQKVLIIVGPTASGKSALGVELAQKFNGEIISADSRQVYRGLNIGTGKITTREMRGVPHHLLDVASPKKKFSAADYVSAATSAYSLIRANRRIAIVVGGTGYYIDAFVGRIAVPNVPPNIKLRTELERKSAVQLYALLGNRDPARARMMATPSERNNKRRLIRALEIATALGKNPRPSQYQKYDTLWIGINPPFKVLEQKIAKRLIARIKYGMIAEARRLREGGLSFKRMEELGLEYRSLARFLKQPPRKLGAPGSGKKITKEEMIEELNRDIRRYAKKQIMYWQRNSDIKWFRPTQQRQIEKTVHRWLSQ